MKHSTFSRSTLAQGLLITTAGLCAGAVAAETPPDAGQTFQELRSLPLPPPSSPINPLQVEEAEKPATPAPAASGEPRILIKAVHVKGVTAFRAVELEHRLVGLVGTEHTLSELNDAARLLTRFYRQSGYPVARAYLPAQTVENGEVTIQVLEGRLDKAVVKNHSTVSDARVNALVNGQIAPGALLSTPAINRALLLLNELPGVGQVQGTLRSGEAVGTSDLVIDVPAGRTWAGDISLDNYGNRYTGQNRLSGHVIYNNPFGRGDRLEARAILSDELLAYTRVSWDTPVWDQGLRAGVDLGYSRYELGKTFASLDVQGTAQTVGLHATYPWVLDVQKRLTSTLTVEQRDLSDEVGIANITTDKSLTNLMLSVYGDYTANGRATSWRIEGMLGDLDIDSPAALAKDKASAKTNGNFTKVTVEVNSLKTLTPKISYYLALNGQWASKNLDSSEKFLPCGACALRAYPAGEGMGDEGWQGTVELRYAFLRQLTGFVFVDAAGIKINQSPFVVGQDNTRGLSGEGVGVAASPAPGFELKVSVAWRGDEKPLSDKDREPRVWAQGSYRF